MDMKKYGGYIALVVAMLLIFSYSIPPIRDGVGEFLDMVFGPLVYEVPFYILIVILSTVTALYSSIIQKYTINYERMQEVQARMKVFQKEFREAQLSNDEKRLKKLESKKDKMMKEQMQMSQNQFKPMAYILLISVPIFFWLIFRLNNTTGEIIMPFFGMHSLVDMVLGPIPAWILWYMICSLTISQVVRKSLNIGGI
ncbi:MAG TPA: EMC3/TMCO1 family protein [Methanoregulaceae archaeon]|nr:EMC3/TMCO1 family protein [Methanoregulaceae archaeon]